MSEDAQTPRSTWADVAKGLLIVLVVFWHVVLKTFLQIDWRIGLPLPEVWRLASDLIWPFLVPLFLLLSGYLARDALQRPCSVVFRSRVGRFFYLYLLWTLVLIAAMWAFPDFPAFVPRSLSELVEALTISQPSTWYLFALALYFLAAKGLQRLPRWMLVAGAAALSVAVAAGLVDVLSCPGSLLYNLLFFLGGAFLTARIRRFIARTRPGVAAVLLIGYLGTFVLLRITDSAQVPGGLASRLPSRRRHGARYRSTSGRRSSGGAGADVAGPAHVADLPPSHAIACSRGCRSRRPTVGLRERSAAGGRHRAAHFS